MYTISDRAPSRNRFRKNPPLEAVLAELAIIGIKPSIDQGKHLKLRWAYAGRSHTTVVPFSASDWRAARNAKAFVRRQIDGGRP